MNIVSYICNYQSAHISVHKSEKKKLLHRNDVVEHESMLNISAFFHIVLKDFCVYFD